MGGTYEKRDQKRDFYDTFTCNDRYDKWWVSWKESKCCDKDGSEDAVYDV